MLDPSVSDLFHAGPGYLNTASVGLPPRVAMEEMRASLADWEAGKCDPISFDADVDRARDAYAGIVGAHTASVGIIGQVSVTSGLVASSLPDGATVLLAEEDFTSLLYPFLADTRLKVKLVSLAALLEEIKPGIDLVAVSAAQSADGRVTDLDDLAGAATDAGVRTYLDLSQAAGWLPIGADRFDVTAAGAYKWLCAPRGTGFITVGEGVDWLIPRHVGWYSAADPWVALYGAPLQVADDARRFNVSPAWFDYVAAGAALQLIAGIGVQQIHGHRLELANHFRKLVGMDESNSAIVSLATPHGDRLAAAGITTATRAGRVRLSFYLYNTLRDAEQAASVLTEAGRS